MSNKLRTEEIYARGSELLRSALVDQLIRGLVRVAA